MGIKKTLVYIPDEKRQFWDEIVSWPVTNVSIQEDQPTEKMKFLSSTVHHIMVLKQQNRIISIVFHK